MQIQVFNLWNVYALNIALKQIMIVYAKMDIMIDCSEIMLNAFNALIIVQINVFRKILKSCALAKMNLFYLILTQSNAFRIALKIIEKMKLLKLAQNVNFPAKRAQMEVDCNVNPVNRIPCKQLMEYANAFYLLYRKMKFVNAQMALFNMDKLAAVLQVSIMQGMIYILTVLIVLKIAIVVKKGMVN